MAFTIKELETLSGIKAHTIRIWEQRYHFLKPSRTTTNIRTYSNEELKTLLNVALLNKYGFKVSQIDSMPPNQLRETILNLQIPDARQEQLINDLIFSMIDMKHSNYEEILNQQIQQHGLPETLHSLVFPFLEKVGILWQTDRIHPVQEHIVSNIIRQKIISAIDGLPLSVSATPLFLLFLPEDEHHELGLLYVFYWLRKKRLPVVYLGADVPSNDVFYIVQKLKPAYLYLHLTCYPKHIQFAKFLQQLSEQCSSSKILISGSCIQNYQKPIPENAVFLSSLPQVTAFISSI